MKKLVKIILTLSLSFALIGCSQPATSDNVKEDASTKDVSNLQDELPANGEDTTP